MAGSYFVRETYLRLKGTEELKGISIKDALLHEEESAFDVFTKYRLLKNLDPIASYSKLKKLQNYSEDFAKEILKIAINEFQD